MMEVSRTTTLCVTHDFEEVYFLGDSRPRILGADPNDSTVSHERGVTFGLSACTCLLPIVHNCPSGRPIDAARMKMKTNAVRPK
jgi:hypothetical protein